MRVVGGAQVELVELRYEVSGLKEEIGVLVEERDGLEEERVGLAEKLKVLEQASSAGAWDGIDATKTRNFDVKIPTPSNQSLLNSTIHLDPPTDLPAAKIISQMQAELNKLTLENKTLKTNLAPPLTLTPHHHTSSLKNIKDPQPRRSSTKIESLRTLITSDRTPKPPPTHPSGILKI